MKSKSNKKTTPLTHNFNEIKRTTRLNLHNNKFHKSPLNVNNFKFINFVLVFYSTLFLASMRRLDKRQPTFTYILILLYFIHDLHVCSLYFSICLVIFYVEDIQFYFDHVFQLMHIPAHSLIYTVWHFVRCYIYSIHFSNACDGYDDVDDKAKSQ
jgi:hypothetical protein